MYQVKGAVDVEVHIQLRNDLGNSKRKKDIINHPLIHVTLIICAMLVTLGNPLCASDVDPRNISLQIFRNQTLRIKKFTGTWKSLNLVCTD